jgi:hypothetical protein
MGCENVDALRNKASDPALLRQFIFDRHVWLLKLAPMNWEALNAAGHRYWR